MPVARALLDLARIPGIRIDVLLHPNPQVAVVMHALLGNERAIHLLQPLDHSGMIAAMRRSTILLSDSGGVQEEAPALGIPRLVLRDKTERPEAIATGNMKLVGACATTMVAEVRWLLKDPLEHARMALPTLPYGDGTAGEQIATIVEEWPTSRKRGRRRIA